MSTTAPPPSPPAKPPSRPRRRWWRIALVIVAILALKIVAYLVYEHFSTQRALSAAIAEAEQDLPRWKLLELDADRPAIPDAENSALFMIKLNRTARGFMVIGAPNYEKIFEKVPPNARLNPQQEQLIRRELGKFPNEVAEARKLKDMPRGRYPVTLSDDFISTTLPDHQNTRCVGDWLSHDAMILAHEGEVDRAVESCIGIVHAGRAIEGDPFLIARLIQLAMQRNSCTTLERVLAQGEASEAALQAIQQTLDREINESKLVSSVRGERAGFTHLFENIQSGKIRAGYLAGVGVIGGSGPLEALAFWFADRFPSTLVRFYPGYLAHMNRGVEIAKLPHHERTAAFDEWEKATRDTRNPVVRTLAPAMSKVNRADIRVQAWLRSSLASVACERYRLKHGAFPNGLDDLVKARLLDAVPRDPFDDQPLRYRRMNDGVIVYSVGSDKTDNQGHLDRENPDAAGADVGFRLWHPSHRAGASLPPVALPEGENGK